MKILLHACCANCTIYPLTMLRQDGHDVTGYFQNPNIHPYLEFKRRLDTVKQYAEIAELAIIYDEDYRLEDFLAAVASNPAERCHYCYSSRLEKTAEVAAGQGFEGFSTSLLYSRYQKHDEIRRIGEELAAKFGLTFVYDDYRTGWQDGIRESKAMGLYRQQYCGCIYSEKERYLPKPKVKRADASG